MSILATLDIETLGTPNNSGTFIVTPSFSMAVENEKDFYSPSIFTANLNVQEQLDLGAKVDASTLAFWMYNESDAAKASMKSSFNEQDSKYVIITGNSSEQEFTVETKIEGSIFNILAVFNHFISGLEEHIHILGNGPEFDISILMELYKANKLKADINFWEVGSLRSFKELFREMSILEQVDVYDSVLKQAESYASSIIDKYNLIKDNIYPVKHDPTFDALVELYTAKYIKLSLVNKVPINEIVI